MPYNFVTATTTDPGSPGWSVFVNVSLKEAFQGFPWNLSTDGLRYEMPIDFLSVTRNFISLPPIGTNTTPAAGAAYVIPAEYPSFVYLSSPRSIVITSNTIPARKEYYPVPATNASQYSITGVNNGLGVISDFQLNFQNTPGEQRSIATYNADLYRLVDLVSTHPLRKIDLNFYWVDQFNNLYPLFLSPFGNLNVKLGFFRKQKLVPNQHYDVVGNGYSVFH